MKVWYKPSTWSYPRAYGALLALVAISLVSYIVLDRSAQNRKAIEKSCILLNNAIVKSSQQAANPNSASAILIGSILANADKKTLNKYKKAASEVIQQQLALTVNCSEVANHPERIHAIQN